MPRVLVGGVELYYEEHGTGDPVVLLHGLGSSGRDWELQVEPLSAHHRLIIVDLRGHGRSDKPPGPYHIAMLSDDLAALLVEVVGDTPAHVVGLSMGGMVAFQLAVDHPERVRSLTIVNSGPEVVPRSLSDHVMLLQRKMLFRLLPMHRIGRILGGRLFPDPDQAEWRKTFVERWAENDKAAYLAATRAIVGWSVRDHIGGIEVPVLVITGDNDYTPVAAKEAYVAELPEAQLVVVADSRHVTPIDQADEFNQVVVDFLHSVPG